MLKNGDGHETRQQQADEDLAVHGEEVGRDHRQPNLKAHGDEEAESAPVRAGDARAEGGFFGEKVGEKRERRGGEAKDARRGRQENARSGLRPGVAEHQRGGVNEGTVEPDSRDDCENQSENDGGKYTAKGPAE